ncbi:MAG: ATP-binding protein [Clostridia bacterium]|nr:ATP-binding protein [Clostridia bacterium]
MKKSLSFRRIILLVATSIFLYSAIMLGVYSLVAPRVFISAKLRELMPRARFLSEQMAMHFLATPSVGIDALGIDSRQWGASVYVYDARLSLLTSTERYPGQLAYPIDIAAYDALLADVIGGAEVSELRRMKGSVDRQGKSVDLLIIGLPITRNEQVLGAVVMMQSLEEIISAMSSLLAALWFSMLAVLAAVMPLAYLYSRRITLPLRQMRDVALRMAAGDFIIRGDDRDLGEVGDLARAMNQLSGALGNTIADLTHERNQAMAIVNALEEGILAVDGNLAVTQANPAMRAMLQSAGGILPSEVWNGFRAVLAEQLSQKIEISLANLSLQLTITPVGIPRAGVSGAIGVFYDQTQARRLEQTRRDYVANVSHELRTPLTALRALIEPLRDGLIHTDAARRDSYDIILRETMRLARLVDDMLELSRLQAGHLALEKTSVNIAPLLHDTASIYAAKARETGRLLELHIPPLPDVFCNSDRTEQVLVALLNNAFTYTPENSTIILRAEPMSDHLRVIVEDNGPGIAEEDLPHIFDRFYKADKSHSGTEGTGLGLAIARELMEKLGETITAVNCEAGGARFIFTLHYQ